MVFDREGYSLEFFLEMRDKHNVACLTYHKYPKNDWPEEELWIPGTPYLIRS